MSNYHLKDTGLTLKAKGLLSMMLSLPDEWNYTTRGLASICKESVETIGKTLRELESAGYLTRRQLRGKNGRITDTEYTIFEKPVKPQPEPAPPDTASPGTENPDTTHQTADAMRRLWRTVIFHRAKVKFTGQRACGRCSWKAMRRMKEKSSSTHGCRNTI